jgi:hypothetical protein
MNIMNLNYWGMKHLYFLSLPECFFFILPPGSTCKQQCENDRYADKEDQFHLQWHDTIFSFANNLIYTGTIRVKSPPAYLWNLIG